MGIRYRLYVLAVVFGLLGSFDRSQGDSGLRDFFSHALLAALLIYLSVTSMIGSFFMNSAMVIEEKNNVVAIVEGGAYKRILYPRHQPEVLGSAPF